ncbi:MAG TPA: hypothetical protein VML75_11640 [Kofleriaceae bacterium]|nr:hypothetical protein [Kofleriaceae bacterium]
MKITILMVAVIGVVGCGKSSGDGGTGSAAEKPSKPAVESPAEPTPTAGAFDLAEFCADVFGLDDVRQILGIPGLVNASREGRLKLPDEMGECGVEERDQNGIPTASASVLADCRGLSLDVAKHREMAKALARGERDEYREVDLGRGGVYTRVFILKTRATHTVTFVHGSTPCSVVVTAMMPDGAPLEQLAQRVHDRLNEGNRPR